MASKFEEYRDKYQRIRLTRTNGILELCVHTDGDSLKWDGPVHRDLGFCFTDIAADPENAVVIITGAGNDFCAETDIESFDGTGGWLRIHQEGRRLLENLLAIPVPVIGAVNGPALVHAELAVLSNIVIAADTASFQDQAHFGYGVVPGDGVHVVWPALLGPVRGSYFLLTGEVIDAQQALRLGIVNEVVSPSQLMPRARALAEEIAAKPYAARYFTRTLLTHEMRRLMLDQLSHGLAVEGLAIG